MPIDHASPSRIHITPNSLAADWVARRAAHIGRPLSAIQDRARPVHVFVNDEILVDGEDAATLRELTTRYDAVIEPLPPVPPQPRGMDPDRRRSVDGMPRTVRARFRGERIALSTLEAAAEQAEGRLQVTSRAGAGTLALANLLAREGGRVLLNSVGQPATLPRSASNEGPRTGDTSDAYQWPEFAGPSRVARAWQLIDAYAQVRSLSTVFLGILDSGFNLDAQGRPQAPSGQSPDVTVLIQYNLTDEGQPAGGPTGIAGKQWHGNSVLSAAAAPINNNAGVAGAAGVTAAAGLPVVVPVLFKTFRTVAEVFRCLQLSVAWGVDVINMSFTIGLQNILLPTSALWEYIFQFAADQGIVIVAAAGNNGAELPDTELVPATRTPGVITVGALAADSMNSRGDSNYGSSVDIWAPGTNIHAMPDPTATNGSLWSQTSLAAPIVSGVAALMKSVQPMLHTGDVKRMLRETGYRPGDPKVTAALDAYAALLRVMGDRLPEGTIEEPNDTAQTARPMFPNSRGALAPVGTTTLSRKSDSDWYQFNVTQYSSCAIDLRFVPELSFATIELVPDDPFSTAPSEVVSKVNPGKKVLTCGTIAPGNYRLVVRGGAPNIYELQVVVTPEPLAPDHFEANNTLETATPFTMNTSGNPLFELARRRFGPGSYDANLHVPGDVDFFHIADIEALALIDSFFRIDASDAPLDVTVFGPAGQPVNQASGIRTVRLTLPAPECWVRVSGATANRYVFTVRTKMKQHLIPGLEEADLMPIPRWWPDPPFRLDQWEQFLQVEITDELKEVGTLRLIGTPGLTLDVLSPSTGEVLVSGVKADAGVPHAVDIDLNGLAPGTHIVRVGRDLSPEHRLNRRLGRSLAAFTLGPAW